MNQEQPQKPEGIKYGDVFNVSGELASKLIAPQDAATLQSAENRAFGQIPKGSPASVMQSASNFNERLGVVDHQQITDVVLDQGASIGGTHIGRNRVIVEAIGGQVLGGCEQTEELNMEDANEAENKADITIGEALEVTARAGNKDKPIDKSDAAAIEAAEVRATRRRRPVPGGLAAEAQAAAAFNILVARDEDKATLGDVLADASAKLTVDKPVTREDATGVISAEVRNKEDLATSPGGVAAAMAMAARLNEDK